MSNELEFAIKGANKVSEKLIIERDRNNTHAYKTLVTTLSEYLRTVWQQSGSLLDKEEMLTYTNLRNLIDNEANKLESVIDSTINNGEYKAHYSWVLSYQKLIDQRNRFDDLFLRGKRIRSLPQYTQSDGNQGRPTITQDGLHADRIISRKSE